MEPQSPPERKIIHIDMDAFFASVEQRDNPRLRGKPVVVGGSPEGRGVVAAASYEARRYGVRSAMPSAQARRRCPDAVFLPPRFTAYRAISRQIQALMAAYTEWIEPLSLDEAYLDVTTNKAGIVSATEVARRLRHEIYAATGLTASAGVAPNKFLAKIASDLNKPDGLAVIPPARVAAFLETLPVGRIHGVGRVTEQKLHALGVQTTGQLRRLSPEILTARFGKVGWHFWRIARGLDLRPVQPNRVRKTIGCETTFAHDMTSPSALSAELEALAARVGERLSKAQLQARTVTLKVKYADFTQITRRQTQAMPVDEAAALARIGTDLLYRRTAAGARAVRLLGLTAGNFVGRAAAADAAAHAGQLRLALE